MTTRTTTPRAALAAAPAVLTAALLASAAAAQPPAGTPVQSPTDTAGIRLRPGTWQYASTMTVNGRRSGAGKRTLSVTPATFQGAESWLIVDRQENGPTRATDSLHVTRTDLAAFRRVTRISGPMGETTLTLDFTPDSVTGQIASGGETQRIAMENVPGAISGDAVVLAVLPALPLHLAWTGMMRVLSPQTRSVAPLHLTVTGEEFVQVRGGRFQTWVVRATAGQTEATYYVAKRGPVVLIEATAPQLGGGVVETALERRSEGR